MRRILIFCLAIGLVRPAPGQAVQHRRLCVVFTDALEPALLGRFQGSFQRRRSAHLIDVIIRSNGPVSYVFRKWHDVLNRKIAGVLTQLAYELDVPLSKIGEYDFRGFLSSLQPPAHGYAQHYDYKGTKLWIEPDGLLVIIDSRFKRFRNDMSHAGRNRFAAYAWSLEKAHHEMAELRALARWALDIRLLNGMDIAQGQLGNTMLDLLNHHIANFSDLRLQDVLAHLQSFHAQGLRAELSLTLAPPIPQLVALGGAELRFLTFLRRHTLREELDHTIRSDDSSNIRHNNDMVTRILRDVTEDFHAGSMEEAYALLQEAVAFAATHSLGGTQRAAITEFQNVFKNWNTPIRNLSSAASFRAMLSGLGEPDKIQAMFSDNGYRIIVLAKDAQSFLAVVEELENGLFRPAARALINIHSNRGATGDMLFAFLRRRGLLRRAISVLLLRGFIKEWMSSDNPGPNAIALYESFSDDPRFIVFKATRRYRIRLRASVPLAVAQQA